MPKLTAVACIHVPTTMKTQPVESAFRRPNWSFTGPAIKQEGMVPIEYMANTIPVDEPACVLFH